MTVGIFSQIRVPFLYNSAEFLVVIILLKCLAIYDLVANYRNSAGNVIIIGRIHSPEVF